VTACADLVLWYEGSTKRLIDTLSLLLQSVGLFIQMLDREIGQPEGTLEYLGGIFKLLNLDLSTVAGDTASHCFVGPDGEVLSTCFKEAR
jgi:hypothetical protein